MILSAGKTVDTCRASGGSLYRDKASAVAASKPAGSVKLIIKSNRPWSDTIWMAFNMGVRQRCCMFLKVGML